MRACKCPPLPNHTHLTILSLWSHASIRSSNGPLAELNCIACVIVICSSSTAIRSSKPRSTRVPVSRYGIRSKSIVFHAASISSSAVWRSAYA